MKISKQKSYFAEDMFIEDLREEPAKVIDLPCIGNVYEIKCANNKTYRWMCTRVHVSDEDDTINFEGFTDQYIEISQSNIFYPFNKNSNVVIFQTYRNYVSIPEAKYRRLRFQYLGQVTTAKMLEWYDAHSISMYDERIKKDAAHYKKTGVHLLPFFRAGGVYQNEFGKFLMCMNAVYLASLNTVHFRGYTVGPHGYAIPCNLKINLGLPQTKNWILKGQMQGDEFSYYKKLRDVSATPNIEFIRTRKEFNTIMYNFDYYTVNDDQGE